MLHHKLISKSHTAILILFFVAALTYATQHALASSNANDDTPAPSSQDIASLESFGKPGEAIDLGLSVSWCEYNIGASDPSDPGLFFGYGDLDGTETSTSYADYPSQDVVGTDRDPPTSIGDKVGVCQPNPKSKNSATVAIGNGHNKTASKVT